MFTFATVASLNPLPKDFIVQLGFLFHEEDLEKFIGSLRSKPSLSIRSNPFKKIALGYSEPVPWCTTGNYLKERPSFTLDPHFHAGAYYVQEASSMFLEQAVCHSVDINQSLNVLDLCAAPGGKSTHLLSLLNSQSLLVSNEVIRSRVNILCENIQKWGCSNAIVTQNDPSRFSHLNGFFDLIVVDAPCSGEGLFRKEPDAIAEWSPANVELCSLRQKRILEDIFPSLRQNGILIYSTCTFNYLENEENLKWLQGQRNIEFIPIPIKANWGIQETKENGIIGYRFFPHQVKGEGFFISVIKKTENENKARINYKEWHKPDKKVVEKIKPWIKDDDVHAFRTIHENITVITKQKQQEIDFLINNFNIVQVGTLIGSQKHERIIPTHSFALSNILNKEYIATIELSKEDAIRYLRKESFSLPGQKPGHTLITYSGLGLGWVNVLESRINNLFPTDWRIKMK